MSKKKKHTDTPTRRTVAADALPPAGNRKTRRMKKYRPKFGAALMNGGIPAGPLSAKQPRNVTIGHGSQR